MVADQQVGVYSRLWTLESPIGEAETELYYQSHFPTLCRHTNQGTKALSGRPAPAVPCTASKSPSCSPAASPSSRPSTASPAAAPPAAPAAGMSPSRRTTSSRSPAGGGWEASARAWGPIRNNDHGGVEGHCCPFEERSTRQVPVGNDRGPGPKIGFPGRLMGDVFESAYGEV